MSTRPVRLCTLPKLAYPWQAATTLSSCGMIPVAVKPSCQACLLNPTAHQMTGPRRRVPLKLAAINQGQLVMQYAATVAGVKTALLLDTGSTGNFITKALAKEAAIPIAKVTQTVLTGGGEVAIRGKCTPRLIVQNHSSSPILLCHR